MVADASNYFDKARKVAAVALIVAGILAIAGVFLDWATIDPPPTVPSDQRDNTEPFNGIDARDGWWVLGAGAVVVVAGGALLVVRRSGYAWIAFLASIVMGGVAFADYRAVDDLGSGLSQRLDVVGEPSPAIGLVVIAVAAIAGIIAAVVGVAASPKEGGS